MTEVTDRISEIKFFESDYDLKPGNIFNQKDFFLTKRAQRQGEYEGSAAPPPFGVIEIPENINRKCIIKRIFFTSV